MQHAVSQLVTALADAHDRGACLPRHSSPYMPDRGAHSSRTAAKTSKHPLHLALHQLRVTVVVGQRVVGLGRRHRRLLLAALRRLRVSCKAARHSSA